MGGLFEAIGGDGRGLFVENTALADNGTEICDTLEGVSDGIVGEKSSKDTV